MQTEVWGLERVWWLVIGIVLLAVVWLVLACLPVLRRLPGLRHGGQRLRRLRAAQESLQRRTLALRERTEELAAQAETVRRRMARIGNGVGRRGSI